MSTTLLVKAYIQLQYKADIFSAPANAIGEINQTKNKQKITEELENVVF